MIASCVELPAAGAPATEKTGERAPGKLDFFRGNQKYMFFFEKTPLEKYTPLKTNMSPKKGLL